jgi:hypothetical protein
MKNNKKPDEYTINLIVLIVFSGALILLGYIFSDSISGFFYALLPTILLILFYILIYRRQQIFESNIKTMVETHIPNIVYIDNPEILKTEFIDTINSAQKYIMTTGSKSKIKEYLSAIETKIEKNEIEYYRILFGEEISDELLDHLSKVIEKECAYIAYTARELAPTLLLTEKVAFIGLPEPIPGEFKTCLKIPDEKLIEKITRYVRIWYAKSERLKSKEDLERTGKKR